MVKVLLFVSKSHFIGEVDDLSKKDIGSSFLYLFGFESLKLMPHPQWRTNSHQNLAALLQALLSRLSDEPATSLLRVAGLKALFEDDNWDAETCGNEPTKGWQIWGLRVRRALESWKDWLGFVVL